MTPGQMTYDLRRLRLHGLIARLPRSHRYRVTPEGLRTALFLTRVYARVLRPGLARIALLAPPGDTAFVPFSTSWRWLLIAGSTRPNSRPKLDACTIDVRLQGL